jgi:hypothetical protein
MPPPETSAACELARERGLGKRCLIDVVLDQSVAEGRAYEHAVNLHRGGSGLAPCTRMLTCSIICAPPTSGLLNRTPCAR